MSSSEIAEARGFLEELRGPMPAQELARRRGAVDTCEIYFDWNLWALDKQRPPEGDWTTWLLLGGRGAGKTRAGAEWVRSLAAQGIGPIALVGMTMTEAVSIMVRGESGILAVHPDRERPVLKGHDLVWPNGVEATVMSASDPERFRGPQFAAAWCDELAKWPRAEEAWDQLQFGLRLGDRPRQLATTTPRPSRLLRRLLDDPHAVVTHKGRLAAFRMADATECQRNEVDFEAGEGPGIGRELTKPLRVISPNVRHSALTGTYSVDIC